MSRILIIEDQRDLAVALREHLEVGGHDVMLAGTGTDGLAAARSGAPELVILDLMLPDRPGEDVLLTLRSEGFERPVLILSARSEEMDKVRGFRIGADDYVTKPFGLLELLARIDNLLRRGAAGGARATVRFGDVEIRPEARQVRRGSREVALRPREMDLLLELARQPGRAVSRRELLDTVWRYDSGVESRTVDWHMAELRRKLEADPAHPRHLVTVRKFGYRLSLDAGTDA